MEFLIKLLVGIGGILLYNLWAFRQYLKQPETLKTKAFWQAYKIESKYMWIWSLVFLIVITALVSYSPDTADAINQLTGLDLTNNIPAFFTFGLGVCSLADTKKK